MRVFDDGQGMIALGAVLALLAVAAAGPATAQGLPANAEQAVREADAAQWKAYNACDAAALAPFFAEDLEFYHDNGGVTRTGKAMVESIMKGICGNPNLRVRRAPLPDTIRFDPVPGYGGVLSGKHQFYMTEKGMPERLSGIASFTTLWHPENGRWQITRAFSLEHRAVPYSAPPGIALPETALNRYAGLYRLSHGDVTVKVISGHLEMATGPLKLTLAAKSQDHFFALEKPLQVDFSGDANGKAAMLTIIENGAAVDSGKRGE